MDEEINYGYLALSWNIYTISVDSNPNTKETYFLTKKDAKLLPNIWIHKNTGSIPMYMFILLTIRLISSNAELNFLLYKKILSCYQDG